MAIAESIRKYSIVPPTVRAYRSFVSFLPQCQVLKLVVFGVMWTCHSIMFYTVSWGDPDGSGVSLRCAAVSIMSSEHE